MNKVIKFNKLKIESINTSFSNSVKTVIKSPRINFSKKKLIKVKLTQKVKFLRIF